MKNEVLQRAKEVRNILHAIKRRKANWIGHILSCILKHIMEGKIEGMVKDEDAHISSYGLTLRK